MSTRFAVFGLVLAGILASAFVSLQSGQPSLLEVFFWLGVILVDLRRRAVALRRPRPARRTRAGAPLLGGPHRVQGAARGAPHRRVGTRRPR